MKNLPEIDECENCGWEVRRADHYRCPVCEQYRDTKDRKVKSFKIEQNEY